MLGVVNGFGGTGVAAGVVLVLEMVKVNPSLTRFEKEAELGPDRNAVATDETEMEVPFSLVRDFLGREEVRASAEALTNVKL